ncbi:hypothetical protein [Halococcus sediminicola]|uniref:hypothetical protein n=1 Tax=Halococcus sediminicola TaxID=1264579 RepID=UPI00067892E4|nr:hypothetical protein [Halococcus sediminicola]
MMVFAFELPAMIFNTEDGDSIRIETVAASDCDEPREHLVFEVGMAISVTPRRTGAVGSIYSYQDVGSKLLGSEDQFIILAESGTGGETVQCTGCIMHNSTEFEASTIH